MCSPRLLCSPWAEGFALVICRLTLFGTWLQAAEDRSNVVILFADDLGHKDIGCYGGPVNTMFDRASTVGFTADAP